MAFGVLVRSEGLPGSSSVRPEGFGGDADDIEMTAGKKKRLFRVLIKHCIKLILLSGYLTVGERILRQAKGLAMGSRVSPVLAIIFMAYWEDLLETKIPSRWRNSIKLWYRYMDDIVLVWTGSRDEFEEFVDRVNNLHPNIEVTTKTDIPLPVLDLECKIENGTIKTSFYRKPLTGNNFLPASSAHPEGQKVQAARNEALRVMLRCSHKEDTRTPFIDGFSLRTKIASLHRLRTNPPPIDRIFSVRLFDSKLC